MQSPCEIFQLLLKFTLCDTQGTSLISLLRRKLCEKDEREWCSKNKKEDWPNKKGKKRKHAKSCNHWIRNQTCQLAKRAPYCYTHYIWNKCKRSNAKRCLDNPYNYLLIISILIPITRSELNTSLKYYLQPWQTQSWVFQAE